MLRFWVLRRPSQRRSDTHSHRSVSIPPTSDNVRYVQLTPILAWKTPCLRTEARAHCWMGLWSRVLAQGLPRAPQEVAIRTLDGWRLLTRRLPARRNPKRHSTRAFAVDSRRKPDGPNGPIPHPSYSIIRSSIDARGRSSTTGFAGAAGFAGAGGTGAGATGPGPATGAGGIAPGIPGIGIPGIG